MKRTKKRKQKKKIPVFPAAQGLHVAAEPKDIVLNSQVRDSSSKIIFDNHTLCSQFLRDYVNLPYLKDVRPEDIEDVSAQYVTLFAEERNCDRVKRVHIRGGNTPFFLVSLIEHKTAPDYNVCMQLFRYMVYIWDTYEKEAERRHKGMSKRADFLYPPILPIIYYEGSAQWSVPPDFRSRIREGKVFGKYLPDFEYYLVPLKDYSNEALMEKRDEISLVMMINKLQTAEDIEKFRQLPGSEMDAILKDTPEYLVDSIANVLRAFLLKLNVPVSDTEKLADKVREKKMGELFADMQKIDIQAEWKKMAATARQIEEKAAQLKEKAAQIDEKAARVDEKAAKVDEKAAKVDEKAAKVDEKEAQVKEKAAKVALAEKKAAETEEKSIKSLVELCQELGASKTSAIRKLMEKKQLSPDTAREKADLYWKE